MGSSPRNTYKALYQQLQKEFRSGVAGLAGNREVLVVLIYSALLENTPAAAAVKAFEKIEDSFIDWNELRVSTAAELCEMLPMLHSPRNNCERMRQTLQSVFQATYNFDLEQWREKGEDAFREYLGSIPFVTRFMADYTVSTVYHKHEIPLDEGALRVLRLLELVDVDEENRETAIGIKRAFSKSEADTFAALIHELGAMLINESTAAKAMKILKAVDPASAKRSCIPMVEEEERDPFKIAREIATMRRNKSMKMDYEADIEDGDDDEFSSEEPSLETPVSYEGDEEEKRTFDQDGEALTPVDKTKKPKKAKLPDVPEKPAAAEPKAEPKPAKSAKPAPAGKEPAEEKTPPAKKKPAAEGKAPAAKAAPPEKRPAGKKGSLPEKAAPAKGKAPAAKKAPSETKKSAPAGKGPAAANRPSEKKIPKKSGPAEAGKAGARKTAPAKGASEKPAKKESKPSMAAGPKRKSASAAPKKLPAAPARKKGIAPAGKPAAPKALNKKSVRESGKVSGKREPAKAASPAKKPAAKGVKAAKPAVKPAAKSPAKKKGASAKSSAKK